MAGDEKYRASLLRHGPPRRRLLERDADRSRWRARGRGRRESRLRGRRIRGRVAVGGGVEASGAKPAGSRRSQRERGRWYAQRLIPRAGWKPALPARSRSLVRATLCPRAASSRRSQRERGRCRWARIGPPAAAPAGATPPEGVGAATGPSEPEPPLTWNHLEERLFAAERAGFSDAVVVRDGNTIVDRGYTRNP